MSKHILHDHLDGGLRPSTAKEIAHELGYEPLDSVDDASIFFDRSNCESLEDYLEAFTHTIALMQSFDNLHRIAYTVDALAQQRPFLLLQPSGAQPSCFDAHFHRQQSVGELLLAHLQ